MNKITIYGNLTSDVELRQTQSGKSVAKFTVAVSNGKDKDGNEIPADFIPCTAWNKQAEVISKFFSKGRPILLTGRFKTEKYQDKNHEDVTHFSSYVLVDNFEFVGNKNSSQQTETATPTQPTEAPATDAPNDSDIPF